MHSVILSLITLYRRWMCVTCERRINPCVFSDEVAYWKLKRVSSDSENVGGGLRGWPAWWRSCCSCSGRQSVPLLLQSRNWDMNSFNTHLITTWAVEQSYVRSRVAEQRVLMFSEPENYHQAEAEADPKLGPGADATLWNRSREDIVWGQWPNSADYVTLWFDCHEGCSLWGVSIPSDV